MTKNIRAMRTKSVSSAASKSKPKGDMRATDEEWIKRAWTEEEVFDD